MMHEGRLVAGHQVAGRYQVARLIGAGDVGEVYDVRDVTTGYAYALKLLRPEIMQNPDAWAALCADAQKASSLDAEAIAKAYEFQTEPSLNAPYVLGEYVTYPSVYTIVTEQGPMGLTELEAILRMLAPAFDAAHQAGLVHRAVKPQNLFANPVDAKSWQVRVTDFGVGTARAYSPPPPGWTATPGWLSAEHADPSTPPTPAMDVYGMGLVAFFALTGRSPFLACRTDPPDLNMLWQEMTAPLPPASQRARELGVMLSPTLDSWFSKALAVSPSHRFGSVGEMSRALSSLVGSSQHVPTMRPPPGSAPGPAAPLPPQQQAYHQPVPEQMQPAYGAAPMQAAQMPQDVTGAPMPPVPQAAPAAAVEPFEAPPKKSGAKILIPIAIGGGLAFVAVLGLGAYLFLGRGDPPEPAPANTTTAAATSAEPPPSATADAPDAEAAAPDAAAEQKDAAPDVEKPEDARITFACDPGCDEVICDGKSIKDPGEGLLLKAGRHTCLGKKAGYNPVKDTFTVEAGKDEERKLALSKVVYTRPPTPAKTCGTLLNPCK